MFCVYIYINTFVCVYIFTVFRLYMNFVYICNIYIWNFGKRVFLVLPLF